MQETEEELMVPGLGKGEEEPLLNEHGVSFCCGENVIKVVVALNFNSKIVNCMLHEFHFDF